MLTAVSIAAKDRFLIGFSQCGLHEDWRMNMEAEMERELMFHDDLSIIIKQAGDDSYLQIKQIKEFVNSKIDLLIVSPNEIQPVQEAIEDVYKKGIPVILIDRRVDSEFYTAYVGGDNYGIGKVAASYIANRLNNKGEIVEILGALSISPALERTSGFNETLKNYPELKNISQITTNWAENAVADNLPKVLTQHPNVNAIYAFNDELAKEASNVVNSWSKDNNILIIGIDGLPNVGGGIELVEKEIISASLIYPTGGKEAIQIAAKILHNQVFQKNNLLPTTLIDPSNVDITRIQFQNINALQEDITKSKNMLELLNGRYRDQQILLFVTLVLLALVAILLVMYLRSFKRLKISNKNLGKQKEEISAQNTELKRLSDELEKITQERLRFYTNISHEFRTPLTLISGPIDKLSKIKKLSAEQKELLHIAQKNITILLKLIEQIIDFRKYELGKYDFSPVSANLIKHFIDWNELFAEVAKRKQIDFKMEAFQEDDFVLDFDVEKMERIYTNLLSNAFKFTPKGGAIKVKLSKEIIDRRECVKVNVLNSGKPIQESKIKEIFDRFYQAGSKTGGSGIGLALVKGYIDLHHGKIEVTNQNGFVYFTFSIPIKQEESIEKEEEGKDPEMVAIGREDKIKDIITGINENEDSFAFDDEFDAEKTSILLIDDHPGIRSYLKSLLKDKYAVFEACDGIEGIRKAVRYIPDLIISDVMMPGIDGVEMCRHLKKEISTSHIPIILLTANVQDEKCILGFESGADDYISKPVNNEILEVRIRKLIEGRKQLKALYGTSSSSGKNKAEINCIEESFIDKFEDLIEKQIQDTELSVDFISKEMGLSRIQLYRKVKALTNYSPIEYLTIYRLKKAVHLMTITEIPLSQIAYQVGFSAPSYFSKVFRKYYDKSPSEYLKDISK